MNGSDVVKRALLTISFFAFAYFGVWEWGICRTYVDEGDSLLVMYKGDLFGGTKAASEGSFIEVDGKGRPLQAGFLERLAGPGRHFFDPIHYKVERIPDVVVDVGQIGVVSCKLGREVDKTGEFLVEGEVGKTKSRGVLRKVLTPGRYRINLYGYDVTLYGDDGEVVQTITLAAARTSKATAKPTKPQQVAKAPTPQPGRPGAATEAQARGPDQSQALLARRAGWVRVPAGYVGVLTNLAPVPPTDGLPAQVAGIQDSVLQPGIYPINPFAQRLDIVEIGFRELSVKAELVRDGKDVKLDENGEPIIKSTGQQGVNFPSNDGFPISLDFTAIWGVTPEQAPRVIREFGNVPAIEKTVMLPDVHNICRIQGSKLSAVDLLTGETREKFQTTVSDEFAKLLKAKNLSLQVGLVRHIHIPPQIRAPIQKANIADETKLTRDMEAVTTTTEGMLEKAKAEVTREEKRVVAETERKYQEALAEGRKEAELIKAETEREVAKVARETAEIEAKSTVLLGTASATVEKATREAESQRFELAVAAFGSPEAYNNYVFAQGLPSDLKLTMLYAGPGTFWTDLKGVEQAAAGKILQTSTEKPAPAEAAK